MEQFLAQNTVARLKGEHINYWWPLSNQFQRVNWSMQMLTQNHRWRSLLIHIKQESYRYEERSSSLAFILLLNFLMAC
jgi:hypothetical protein